MNAGVRVSKLLRRVVFGKSRDRNEGLGFAGLTLVAALQEITYDYKLPLESKDKKIPCHCGAHICKGTMN